MTDDELTELHLIRNEVGDIREDQRRMWAVARWIGGTFGVAALAALLWLGALAARVETLERTDITRGGTMERLARIEAIVERIERQQMGEFP